MSKRESGKQSEPVWISERGLRASKFAISSFVIPFLSLLKYLRQTKMSRFIALPRSFYEPSAKVVARNLLGHWLIRHTPSGYCGGAIVETEAYLSNDPACHGFSGLSRRNSVMFGEPGHGYVYLIYGYHFCVNAVCRRAGIAEAVLIRAIEPTFGESLLLERRKVEHSRDLTNGPAKLCQAMDIDRTLDGIDLCNRHAALFIAENPGTGSFRKERGPIITARRIGITRAADLPLRFFLEGSACVSQRRFGLLSYSSRARSAQKRAV